MNVRYRVELSEAGRTVSSSVWSFTTPQHASWLNMVEIEIGAARPASGPSYRGA